MDNKMTDNEIIGNLKFYKISMRVGKCIKQTARNALDLINRLQSDNKAYKHYYNECLKDLKNAHAEIERLKQIVDFTPARGSTKSFFLNMVLDNVRTEAIKECIEKVKEQSSKMDLICSGALVRRDYTITEIKLDNILKEMVSD